MPLNRMFADLLNSSLLVHTHTCTCNHTRMHMHTFVQHTQILETKTLGGKGKAQGGDETGQMNLFTIAGS